MFRVLKHIWRTDDGRLVQDGDPAAAVLAYPAGDEFSDSEALRRGLLDVYPGPDVKAAPKVADKAAARAGDKSLSRPETTKGTNA